ncbi:4-amino-4-deoxy-L-arabinose transferase [Granulicella rosea]|uniref:4-amino-4-deoxy-L-arabinose transferase n=1 Tax=Granulicella rosea TaxID=474952 RepID=A0A239L1G7_9BACT|nr:glycosyltransferase family 39 protein [Granulicella rosea]SNT24447.1 4-amino-4-deoxy-L-arabinose transferase [Granulicella rosea]
MTNEQTQPAPTARWSPRSLALILAAWFVLQIGGLFSPGLLDDVDSVYIEIAREMLHRHDYVTPYIDGIRFFDKPPLMYWMAAGSMRVFGEYDWAARLPIAFAMLALLLAVYALGLRLFARLSPVDAPDRGALYSALAVATGIGPYLYTRFFIPDILICLWMTLSVHLFLIAIERLRAPHDHRGAAEVIVGMVSTTPPKSALTPCLLFAATLALNLLTKGLIGLVFPLGFVFLYLAITRQLRLLWKLHLIPSLLVFGIIALPWHILAALRNPAIALPAGVGLPARGGWAWFYLYNEHIARFLQKRIPHDYGQTPVWLFWSFAIIWMIPWSAFLPAAIELFWPRRHQLEQPDAGLPLFLWAGIVLGFFTLSARQEYYSLPALPALGLLAGGALAWADRADVAYERRKMLLASRYMLVLGAIVSCVCGYFAVMAPTPKPGVDIFSLLTNNPELYNLSLGHLYDLTGAAMGLFRAPLAGVAIAMLLIGPGSYLLRRQGKTYAANLTLAAAMVLVLTCVHGGLARFYPILGSKELALDVAAKQSPGDLIVLDGELTSGSTLLFYTRQPVHLVNGRVNGPWYGSFWPDAPHIFEDETSLRQLWGSRHIFLLTYNPVQRMKDLQGIAPVHTLASAGGKTVLTNF